MSSAEKKKAGSSGWIVLQVFLTGVAYYLATEIAWALCFPNSKVSLLFPPHAVLVVILLLVPVRHWWAYTLATVLAHFVATQQAHWPVLYALHCEAFDAVQNVLAAAGIRLFIKSPLNKNYAARRDGFRFDCRDHRSLRHGVVGRGLYHLQRFRNSLLD
jgi:integral membrane sensor domain MASE1